MVVLCLLSTRNMGSTETATGEHQSTGGLSGDVVGGLITLILGLIHLYVLQLGGTVGFAVFFVVWPLIGGAVATVIERSSIRDWATVSTLAGVFGAIGISLLVLLTGFAGTWPPLIPRSFGASLWPVTFAVLIEVSIAWFVFGLVGGFITHGIVGTGSKNEGEVEVEADGDIEAEAADEETESTQADVDSEDTGAQAETAESEDAADETEGVDDEFEEAEEMGAKGEQADPESLADAYDSS